MEDSFPCSVHPLNDKVVQHHFLFGPLYDVLLHRAFCHQTVDIYLPVHRKTVRWSVTT